MVPGSAEDDCPSELTATILRDDRCITGRRAPRSFCATGLHPARRGDNDAVLLLSHNPDFVENIRDRRVGLVLSGHTHGGQIVVPGYGAPVVPSHYGQEYLYGLVDGPCCPVFITRGVETSTPPVRFLCRPEVVLITLV
jgi:predicted MPP superfamily phosphohydrolase